MMIGTRNLRKSLVRFILKMSWRIGSLRQFE